jgi:hypothetical protein
MSGSVLGQSTPNKKNHRVDTAANPQLPTNTQAAKMHLMYYLDANGKRVYTLKVRYLCRDNVAWLPWIGPFFHPSLIFVLYLRATHSIPITIYAHNCNQNCLSSTSPSVGIHMPTSPQSYEYNFVSVESMQKSKRITKPTNDRPEHPMRIEVKSRWKGN